MRLLFQPGGVTSLEIGRGPSQAMSSQANNMVTLNANLRGRDRMGKTVAHPCEPCRAGGSSGGAAYSHSGCWW